MSYNPFDINNSQTFDSRPKTPSSAETIKKYQKRRDRDEKKQDARYGRLNQQLEDLIKQGQAALSSRIEVGDERDATDGEDFSGDSGVEMGFEDDRGEAGLLRGGNHLGRRDGVTGIVMRA